MSQLAVRPCWYVHKILRSVISDYRYRKTRGSSHQADVASISRYSNILSDVMFHMQNEKHNRHGLAARQNMNPALICNIEGAQIMLNNISYLLSVLRLAFFVLIFLADHDSGSCMRTIAKKQKSKSALHTRGCTSRVPLNTRGALHARHMVYWENTTAYMCPDTTLDTGKRKQTYPPVTGRHTLPFPREYDHFSKKQKRQKHPTYERVYF